MFGLVETQGPEIKVKGVHLEPSMVFCVDNRQRVRKHLGDSVLTRIEIILGAVAGSL